VSTVGLEHGRPVSLRERLLSLRRASQPETWTNDSETSSSIPFTTVNIRRIVLFLADRTNGRAIGTVLRAPLSCCLSSVMYVLWLNGASLSKSYY